MLAGKRVAVVLPAYNAARTLKCTNDEIPRDVVDGIIPTDDASSASALQSARRLGIVPLHHDRNRADPGVIL